jgi:hypothetical protein
VPTKFQHHWSYFERNEIDVEVEGVHDFFFHNDNSLALGFENIFPFDNIQLMKKNSGASLSL